MKSSLLLVLIFILFPNYIIRQLKIFNIIIYILKIFEKWKQEIATLPYTGTYWVNLQELWRHSWIWERYNIKKSPLTSKKENNTEKTMWRSIQPVKFPSSLMEISSLVRAMPFSSISVIHTTQSLSTYSPRIPRREPSLINSSNGINTISDLHF